MVYTSVLWLYLSLDGLVEFIFDYLPDDTVPLGALIRIGDRDRVRQDLRLRRIFCPIHWRLPAEVRAGCFASAVELSAACLTLPIDQRYDTQDMVYMADILKELI